MLYKIYKSNTSNYPWGCPEFMSKTLSHSGLGVALTQCLSQACADRHENFIDIAACSRQCLGAGGKKLYSPQKSPFQDNMGWPEVQWMHHLEVHAAALFKLWGLASIAEHWCHVVPLSWMALISALSWGRLIPTVLTLSPVLHCDTGYRRNSQHSHFSLLRLHLFMVLDHNEEPSIGVNHSWTFIHTPIMPCHEYLQ